MEIDSDITLVIETRASTAEAGRIHTSAKAMGHKILLGRPLPKKQNTLGEWRTPPGGVGVASRASVPTKLVTTTEQVGHVLWETNRFIHTTTPIGAKGRALHLMVLYAEAMGVIDRKAIQARNDDLVQKVLDHANTRQRFISGGHGP